MKPIPNGPEGAPLLAFGAHPDEIEFGCGGVIARAGVAHAIALFPNEPLVSESLARVGRGARRF